MGEVIINFDSQGSEGIVAAGTYLSDAAKRLGVRIDGDCLDPETAHECIMKVSKGRALLSKPTQTEMEQLSSQARKSGERLACQTILEKPGEVTIMSVKRKQEEKKDPKVEQAEGYKKEFEEMPLDKKIASLVELEAIALGETFSYVLNSPYKAFGKVMDVMAGFGLDLERKDKDAKRPDEHKKEENGNKTGEPKKSKAKTSARKKTSRKRPSTAKRRTTTKTAAKKTAKKRTPKKPAEGDSD